MADDGAERTEPASEKRRQDFREKGDLARSRDIVSVLVLFSAFAYFMLFGDWIFGHMSRVMHVAFDFQSWPQLDVLTAQSLLWSFAERIGLIVAPLVAVIVLVSVLGNVAQVGILFTTKPLEPDLTKLNFFSRVISTFFSKQVPAQLVLNLTKIAVLITVVWLTLSGEWPRVTQLARLSLEGGIVFIIELCLRILLNASLVLIVVAVADYLWNLHMMEEKMKMTRQEVKDEHKEVDGNPELKGQMRKRARDMANNRMMQAVPAADVVINNPTHLSIALRYRQGLDAAPVVVAKGADYLAMRIRRVAKAHDVPMVTNVPLARLLYRHVKVSRPVPSQFYRAVAEVLAYVYRLRRAAGRVAADRGRQP